MEKLELKHLAGYLPYGLNGVLTSDCEDEFSDIIDSEADEAKFKKGAIWKYSGYADSNLCVPLGEGELDGFLMSNENTYSCFYGVIKPILRPLSDIIKEVEIDGKKIIPLDYISTSIKDSQQNARYLFKGFYDNLAHWKVKRLLELNFDVDRLIEKGLAIDINTL